MFICTHINKLVWQSLSRNGLTWPWTDTITVFTNQKHEPNNQNKQCLNCFRLRAVKLFRNIISITEQTSQLKHFSATHVTSLRINHVATPRISYICTPSCQVFPGNGRSSYGSTEDPHEGWNSSHPSPPCNTMSNVSRRTSFRPRDLVRSHFGVTRHIVWRDSYWGTRTIFHPPFAKFMPLLIWSTAT